jgi:hypothetical protein
MKVRAADIAASASTSPRRNEREHFERCPACGGWIDLRNLGQVLAHAGPLPHPAEDQPQ